MKKILLPILALGGLLFASSCQMDEPDAGTLTGEVDFTITAGIPGSINTYASNDGGSTNVDKDYYEQRFILEVYDGENYTNLAYREVKTVEVGEKTSFDVRLLAKKYKFALWADFVTNESSEDNLYNTSEGLNAVKIRLNRPAGQEIADAYCYSEEVDLTEGSLSKSFTLRRPFGKIRLISTDKPANDVNNSEGYTPESVTVTYGEDVLVPTGYNVLTGEASGEIDAGNYIFKPYKEEVTVGGTGKGKLYILGIDYILASKSMTNVSFDVQVDDNGKRSVTNIPVSANKLTTVIGNFYTNEGSIDVIVEDEFGNGEDVRADWDGSSEEPETATDDANKYLITTPAELAWVAEQVNSRTEYFEGKTVLLMNDIDLYGSNWTPVGNVTAYPTVTFKGTFDGQNHTISNLTASDDAAGYAAAGLFGSILGTVKNVTLKDVNIRSTHYAGAVVGYSSMNGAIIENCHVDGGTITSVPENTGSAYDNGDKAGGIIGYYVTDDKVTNCSAKNLTITAYRDLGGITGCGPQSGMTNCSVENIILVQDNTNGYESEAITTVGALGGRDVTNEDQPYDGEFASAVTKKVVDNVSSDLELAAAIADNATIYLTPGTYIIPDDAQGKTLTFIGTGNPGDTKIATQDDGSYEGCDYSLDGATVTFENITINTDSKTYTGYARCKGTYKNCVINGTYTLYGDSKFENCIFNVSGDVYNIWTWGAPNATFDGCTFNSDGKAMLLYGTQNTKLTINKCTFNDSDVLDVKKAAIEIGDDYGMSYTLVVNETTVNGFAINNEGINTGTTLWANKNSMPKDRLSVTVDGVENPIYANSQDELAKATIENNATIILAAGDYTIPSSAKGMNLTFVGTGDAANTIIECKNDGYDNLNGSTVTFENLTIETDNETYRGFIHVSGATYKNCIIKNQLTLYSDGDPLLFDNCTFYASGNNYNVWTWGTSATFNDCTFDCDGKAMLVYGGGTSEVTFTNCIFNDLGGQNGKAAIETGNDYDATYTININKCTVNGFDVNSVSSSKVWGNKDSMTADKLNVIIDNVDVY